LNDWQIGQGTAMAAAIPAEDVRMQTPNWSASEEQSLAAGPPHSSNAPPSPDARSPAQEPDNPDYNLASSAGDIRLSGSKNVTYRDLSHKQVKVLSFSLYLPLFFHIVFLCAPSFFLRSAVSLSLSTTVLCSILSSA
jgi:hypothetical protein